jgi:hypothetical protein
LLLSTKHWVSSSPMTHESTSSGRQTDDINGPKPENYSIL